MRPRLALSFGNFFICMHYALMLYITTPYLASVMREEYVGLVLSAGALVTLATFPFVPRVVRALGPRRLAVWALAASASILLFLALYPSAYLVIFAFVLFLALAPVIGYFLDLLLEASTEDEGSTGKVRTLYITFGNIAYLTGALLVGLLLGPTNAYSLVLYVAAFSVIPFALLLLFAKVPDGNPPVFAHMLEVVKCLWKDADTRAVTVAYGTLQFFFYLVPYFTPLYLHSVLGIPWSELGLVYALTIIPFLLLEYPAGWLADHLWGDKELMAVGFLIMGVATAAFAFSTAATPLLTIAIVLLVTRIGAAIAEAMCETHFFRRVSERDANSVGVFRMMRPVGALLGPLFASVLLLVSDFSIMFFSAGILIIAVGVAGALSIKDIR